MSKNWSQLCDEWEKWCDTHWAEANAMAEDFFRDYPNGREAATARLVKACQEKLGWTEEESLRFNQQKLKL